MAEIEIGDRFEDKDSRAGERVIEIVAKSFGAIDRYRYVVCVSSRMPWTVATNPNGQRGRAISRATLLSRYTKVSH